MRRSRVLAVDFDETIAVLDKYGSLQPTPGAASALRAMRDSGWRIVIHTCRTTVGIRQDSLGQELEVITSFLTDNGIPFDDIYSGEKMIADFYIDDRAIPYEGHWDVVVQELARRSESRSK